MRVNNLERVTEVSFKDLEIFPGKKITVLVKSLPSHALNGFKYTVRPRTRTFITDRERLLSLELLAGKDVDPPSLAGKVELTLGGTRNSFNFGDPGSGEYLEFDPTNKKLRLKACKISQIETNGGFPVTGDLAVTLIPLKLPDGAGDDTLEIKFTLFTPRSFPDSLKHLFAKNLAIMKDENTADFFSL